MKTILMVIALAVPGVAMAGPAGTDSLFKVIDWKVTDSSDIYNDNSRRLSCRGGCRR